MGRVNVGHYVVGNVGLALLRIWLTGDRAEADRRLGELRELVNSPDDPPLTLELDAPEEGVEAGYARWAGSYESAPNALIELEQPIVRAMIDRGKTGDALDAACGTGRHTRYLHERGHRPIGVDLSPEMLAVARASLPEVELRQGNLESLPVESASIDLVVCALALTHCADLGPPLIELARTLRPGGRLILSDFHPGMLLLGGSGFFIAPNGAAGHVRSYHHPISAYLSAIRGAGLRVLDCVEPTIRESDLPSVSALAMAFAPAAFRDALVGLPIALVWELSLGEMDATPRSC